MKKKKTGPIHELVPDQKGVLAITWCGVDPYLQRVQVRGIRVFDESARPCEKCKKAKLDDQTARYLARSEAEE